MLFNSVEFLLFAAFFFPIYGLLKHTNDRRYFWIVAASFFFYGWWDWHYLFLILVSGGIDYFAALALPRYPKYRRLILLASLVTNLGILFTFKYLLWALANIEQFFVAASHPVNVSGSIPEYFYVLPIGISFYTFQSMSYTIDVWRGQLKPIRNPLLFFAYLSMFPQLVAGPIVRAADVVRDLTTPKAMTQQRFQQGLEFVAKGFFKKVVIADSIAPYVNAAFDGSTDGGLLFWWVIVIGFAIQIYCDFSGYSDIAIGLARWMGIDFKANFDHPYIARSLREFWQRWHISLSSWFRDYVYIPLGGSRCSTARRDFNTMATMMISGLWHGAAWTFLIWGALHGAMLVIEKRLGALIQIADNLAWRIAQTALTFVLVLLAWVFFRSSGVEQALNIIASMFDITSFSLTDIEEVTRLIAFIGLVLLRECYVWFKTHTNWWQTDYSAYPATQPVLTASLLVICLFYRGPGSEFIYFQF